MRGEEVERVKDQVIPIEVGHAITEVGGEWLAELKGTLRENTRGVYETYIVTLAKFFVTIENCTTERIAQFASKRLGEVTRGSLKHERSTLKMLLRWCHGRGYLRREPTFPELPARAKGTKFKRLNKQGEVVAVRRRVAADSYTVAEIEKLLMALPEWSKISPKSKKRHPVRAKYILIYDSTLRPECVEKLSVPEHWSSGRDAIWIPQELDKSGIEGYQPLTPRALAALESVAPEKGLIFGAHKHPEYLLAAALKAMPEHKARRFCAQHLRSAGITHAQAKTQKLGGVQLLGRHKRITTTALYIRPGEEALAEVIDILSKKQLG